MNESSKKQNEWNTTDREIISSFLTKKRWKIMQILYTRGELSHGQLADAIDTSAASLSNILLKFDSFQYKLIDNRSEGKHRYYYLTELGREFIKTECYENNYAGNENVIFHEPFLAIQRIEESIKKVQDKWGEKWELFLDNTLIYHISYGRFPVDQSGEEIADFFLYVEKALINDYENSIWTVMKAVGINSILQERMVEFLERFEAFRPLLNARESGQIDELQIYELLEGLVCRDMYQESRIERYIQKLQWNNGEYDLLLKTIEEIVLFTTNKERQEIYSLLNKYMAGYQDISAFLAMKIDEKHKNELQKAIK